MSLRVSHTVPAVDATFPPRRAKHLHRFYVLYKTESLFHATDKYLVPIRVRSFRNGLHQVKFRNMTSVAAILQKAGSLSENCFGLKHSPQRDHFPVDNGLGSSGRL